MTHNTDLKWLQIKGANCLLAYVAVITTESHVMLLIVFKLRIAVVKIRPRSGNQSDHLWTPAGHAWPAKLTTRRAFCSGQMSLNRRSESIVLSCMPCMVYYELCVIAIMC